MKVEIFGALLVMSLTAGCYVEDVKERAPSPPGSEASLVARKTDSAEAGQCTFTASTGCLQGFVPAAPELTVAGIKFMDANDLAQRFSELVPVKPDNSGVAVNAKVSDPTIRLLTQIDNASFAKDFQIFVKSNEGARSAEALANGGFKLNKLPEDTYRVRVQKQIKFELHKTVTTPVEGSTTGATRVSDVTKLHCATLYSDAALEVVTGQRTQQVFSDYKLYLTESQCSDFGQQPVLTL